MQAFQPQLLAGLSSLRSPICHSQPHLPNVGPTASRRRASHVTGSSSGVLQREESFLDTGRSWTSSQPAQPEAEPDFYGGGGGGGSRVGVGHSRDGGGDDGEAGGLRLPWNPFLL